MLGVYGTRVTAERQIGNLPLPVPFAPRRVPLALPGFADVLRVRNGRSLSTRTARSFGQRAGDVGGEESVSVSIFYLETIAREQ